MYFIDLFNNIKSFLFFYNVALYRCTRGREMNTIGNTKSSSAKKTQQLRHGVPYTIKLTYAPPLYPLYRSKSFRLTLL
jgi:hypothetical protein